MWLVIKENQIINHLEEKKKGCLGSLPLSSLRFSKMQHDTGIRKVLKATKNVQSKDYLDHIYAVFGGSLAYRC